MQLEKYPYLHAPVQCNIETTNIIMCIYHEGESFSAYSFRGKTPFSAIIGLITLAHFPASRNSMAKG